MSDTSTGGKIELLNFNHKSKAAARRHAVEASLEVLRALAMGGGVQGGRLSYHMNEVGKYADSIQRALRPTDLDAEE